MSRYPSSEPTGRLKMAISAPRSRREADRNLRHPYTIIGSAQFLEFLGGIAASSADVARYLKVVGDPREVVTDPKARYFGGRIDEHSLVRLGEAGLGRIGFDEWLRRSQSQA
jgi:hypothetical protein